MARPGPWLLLLLALRCPALPTDFFPVPSSPDGTTLLRLTHLDVGGSPLPSLAPPITLLVGGKSQTLVVCLVLNVAPSHLKSPIWFSAANGSALDAFTYSPSPAADGTWTGLAQLSLPSEDLVAWESLVCHTGPGVGNQSWSTRPLQLSGKASSTRNCFWEPLRGTRGLALQLGALRLLLFKLLLLNVLLTCGRLRAPPGRPRPPAPRPAPRPRPRRPRRPRLPRPAAHPARLGRPRAEDSPAPACPRCPARTGLRVHADPRDP